MCIAEPGYVWHGYPFFSWKPRKTIDGRIVWLCTVRYAETWWIEDQKWAYDIWHDSIVSKTLNGVLKWRT